MKKPDLYLEVGLNGTSVPSVEMAPMVAVSDYPFCLVFEWVYKKARLLEYEPGKQSVTRFLHGYRRIFERDG